MIFADGRFIAARTDATDLFARDTNGDSDIFYRDRGPLVGDLNGDGEVTSFDLDILLQNLDYTCSGADLNHDGVVDEDDEDLLTGNYGGDCDSAMAAASRGEYAMKHPLYLIFLLSVSTEAGTECGDSRLGSCCEPFFGCNDPQCCDIVCEIIPLCCEGGWFESCASLANELCPSCGADCGDDAAGNCCEIHSGPFCDDADCCSAVCAQLPECCEDSWSQPCVDLAFKLCTRLTDCLPDTCQGFCGGRSPGGCFCDTACCGFGDCCLDFCKVCSDISCCGNSCPADFDKSGNVDGSDLGELLLAWGECKSDCAPDLTGDSQVDGQDLGELLLAWGECNP